MKIKENKNLRDMIGGGTTEYNKVLRKRKPILKSA